MPVRLFAFTLSLPLFQTVNGEGRVQNSRFISSPPRKLLWGWCRDLTTCTGNQAAESRSPDELGWSGEACTGVPTCAPFSEEGAACFFLKRLAFQECPTRQPTILTEAPRAPKPHMSPNTGQQPQNHKEPKAAKLYRTLFITLEPRS